MASTGTWLHPSHPYPPPPRNSASHHQPANIAFMSIRNNITGIIIAAGAVAGAAYTAYSIIHTLHHVKIESRLKADRNLKTVPFNSTQPLKAARNLISAFQQARLDGKSDAESYQSALKASPIQTNDVAYMYALQAINKVLHHDDYSAFISAANVINNWDVQKDGEPTWVGLIAKTSETGC